MRRYLISYSRYELRVRDRKTNEVKLWKHISQELADLIITLHYSKNPPMRLNNNKITSYNLSEV